MTVRIAAVGDPGHVESRVAVDRARARSVGAAADLEWWPVFSTEADANRLGGFDAVWLIDLPQGPEGERLRDAAWQAHRSGTPILTSTDEPPSWFVAQARHRAAHRRQQERRLAAAALEAMEREPRSSVHQLRGPRHRWWRPLVALVVAVAVLLFGVAVLFAADAVLGVLGVDADWEDPADPWTTLLGNLVLAALIPATLVGVWAGFRRSPWRVLSVAGRLRWGWLGWCLLVLTPLWATFLAVYWVVFDQEVLDRPDHWVALLVITLLTTPLQAAGEEVAFRGGLVQGVGAWIRSPVVALVVTTCLSTAAFAAAHGSADLWIIVELGSFAVAGCWLAWRTGGLEAAIALHVVNNVLLMSQGALLGGLEQSYVDGASQGSALSAAMGVVATALVTAVLLRLARRHGVAPPGWRTPALG
ncbi:MAG: lysostaphin resistance A-like protein [Dermatophilaceae bacterium]